MAFEQRSAGLCSASQRGSSSSPSLSQMSPISRNSFCFPLLSWCHFLIPRDKLPRVLLLPSLFLAPQISTHTLASFYGWFTNRNKNNRGGHRSNKHGESPKFPRGLQCSLGIYFLLSQQHPLPRSSRPRSLWTGSRLLLRVVPEAVRPQAPGRVF